LSYLPPTNVEIPLSFFEPDLVKLALTRGNNFYLMADNLNILFKVLYFFILHIFIEILLNVFFLCNNNQCIGFSLHDV